MCLELFYKHKRIDSHEKTQLLLNDVTLCGLRRWIFYSYSGEEDKIVELDCHLSPAVQTALNSGKHFVINCPHTLLKTALQNDVEMSNYF